MRGFPEERELTIRRASRVLAMLAVDRAAPQSELWVILERAGAGKNLPPQQYGIELTAFAAHVIFAAFSIYTEVLGSFVSFKGHDFLIGSVKDAELSFTFQDRGGEYNVAGGITAASPEEDWTIDDLVTAFWNNVSPGQSLPATTADEISSWVHSQLLAGRELFPSIKIVPD